MEELEKSLDRLYRFIESVLDRIFEMFEKEDR